jgi:hypothetical protein
MDFFFHHPSLLSILQIDIYCLDREPGEGINPSSLVTSDKKIIALCYYRYSPNALAGEIINHIIIIPLVLLYAFFVKKKAMVMIPVEV